MPTPPYLFTALGAIRMISHELEAIEYVCNRLTERRATLFLGAGVNANIKNGHGEECPLGQRLADLICRDLLAVPNAGLTLDEAAEIARYKVGDKELNRYLYDLLISFSPGPVHLGLVQLPWDSIFTTNYDLLVERASEHASVSPAGTIRQVCSVLTDLSSFSDNDILYYKLHGSIDVANTDEGRLVLTKKDYRFYEQHRTLLFKRLKSDLLKHTFLFLGYSLGDNNFRAILEDCRSQLGATALPRSFALRKGASEVEQLFWRDQYNIEILNIDAADFMNLLKGTWIAQGCAVVPFDIRRTQQYLQVDANAAFEKVGESYYRVRSEDCPLR